jgi:molybdate transport system substrate-binding protein
MNPFTAPTKIRHVLVFLLAVLLLIIGQPVLAEDVRIAVASNFRNTGRMLAEQFNENSDNKVVLIFGSSGKLYAQVSKGAPFDALLSADRERPEKLESEGHAVAGSRFTYAIGKLTLWSSKPGLVDPKGEILRQAAFEKLAMANPRHAPYGIAAKEVIDKLDLKEILSGKIVLGSNIEQTFQYISKGNADLGFVARAQLAQSIWGSQGSRWEVPDSLYQPIEQQAVLVNDNATARAFLKHLGSAEARALILSHGYDLP